MKGLEMKIMAIKVSLDRLNRVLDTSKEKISKQEDMYEDITQNEVQWDGDGRNERVVWRGGRQTKKAQHTSDVSQGDTEQEQKMGDEQHSRRK